MSSSIINIYIYTYVFISIIAFCVFKVASHAADKLFIATPCCVQAMDNIWYNKIHPEVSKKRNEVSMTIGVFSLGLLAPFFVTYRQGKEVGIILSIYN